jgi:hypothetical protein
MNLASCKAAVTISHAEYMRVALPPLVGHLGIHSFEDDTLVLDLAGPENPDRIRARLNLHPTWHLSIEGRHLVCTDEYPRHQNGTPDHTGLEPSKSKWRQRVILPYLAKISAIALGLERPDLRIHFLNGLVLQCLAGPDGSAAFTLEHWPHAENRATEGVTR